MKRVNVIFTGRYLIVWYTLFILMVLFMILDYMRLSAVREYKYTVYDRSGQPVSTAIVNVREEIRLSRPDKRLYEVLKKIDGDSFIPVEKSFEPVREWRNIYYHLKERFIEDKQGGA